MNQEEHTKGKRRPQKGEIVIKNQNAINGSTKRCHLKLKTIRDPTKFKKKILIRLLRLPSFEA